MSRTFNQYPFLFLIFKIQNIDVLIRFLKINFRHSICMTKKSEQEMTKEVENTEISVIESTVASKEDNTVVEIIAADNETNSTASKTAATAVKSSTEGNPVLEESSH